MIAALGGCLVLPGLGWARRLRLRDLGDTLALTVVLSLSITAVVATATGGAREVIEDQKTGLLVPIGDVDRLAGSVINLLSDPEKRRTIATQSAQSALKKFSLARMVDEVLTAYRS